MLHAKEVLGILACVVASVALVGALAHFDVLSSLDQGLHDHLQLPKEPTPAVQLIVIDDKTFEELGPYPWSRFKYMQLLDRLSEAKAISFQEISLDDRNSLEKGLVKKINESGKVFLSTEYDILEYGRGIMGKRPRLPRQSLSQVAAGVGYTNFVPDDDGIVRSAHFAIQGEYPSLVELLYETYVTGEVAFPDVFPLRFAGPPGTYRAHSYVHVLSGNIAKSQFKDAIVLIGTMDGEYFVPTSDGRQMSQLEFTAHVLQALMEEDYLLPADRKFSLFLIPLGAIALGLCILLLPIYIWIPIYFGLLYGYYRYVAFSYANGIVLDFIHVPLTLSLVAISSITFLLIYEGMRKSHITHAFGKYVSPVVVKELLKNEKSLRLGGQRKTLTIFFSDIRDFTSHTEAMEPEKMVGLLNEYFTTMTHIINTHGGIVDKFMGDAIMGFWGAPLDRRDHAKATCLAALDMRFKMRELQEQWTQRELPSFHIGIGIHTGEVIVGNMGSADRFDYTVIGDNVNLASRLEGLNKTYGTVVIISEETQKHLNKDFLTRRLDIVRVKGKRTPVTVYELICIHPTAAQRKTVESFEKAFDLYLAGKFTKAQKEFKRLGKSFDDHVSTVFASRCERYKKHRPKDWTGVHQM